MSGNKDVEEERATFILDPIETLIFGSLFSLKLCRRRAWEHGESLLESRDFRYGFWVTTFVGIGLAVFCYSMQPDWMWAYLVPDDSIPGWVVAYLFLMYYAPFFAGFLGAPALERRWRHAGLVLFVAALLAEGLLFLLTGEAYRAVGTYDDFHAGRALPLVRFAPFAITPLGIVLHVAFPAAFAAVLWLWLRLPSQSTVDTR